MRLTRWIMMALLGVLAGFAIGAATRPSSAPAKPDGELVREYVSVAGEIRSYLVHEPKGWDGKTKLPLVICLHGATDNAAYAAEAYGWVGKADKEKFLAIFPDGLPDEAAGETNSDQHYWTPASADNAQETDDVRFLVKMIDRVENRYAVDPGRVFLCGHSNGAVMAYAFAARHPEKIAALGIVAGTVGLQTQKGIVYFMPDPKTPIPLIIFHGREDPNLPYDPPPLPLPDTAPAAPGGSVVSEEASQTLGVAASVAFWVKANHCDPKPRITTSDDGEITRASYAPADPKVGKPIILITLKHGNHMWPGAKDMPGKTQKPSQAIDATAELWAFFAASKTAP